MNPFSYDQWRQAHESTQITSSVVIAMLFDEPITGHTLFLAAGLSAAQFGYALSAQSLLGNVPVLLNRERRPTWRLHDIASINRARLTVISRARTIARALRARHHVEQFAFFLESAERLRHIGLTDAQVAVWLGLSEPLVRLVGGMSERGEFWPSPPPKFSGWSAGDVYELLLRATIDPSIAAKIHRRQRELLALQPRHQP